MEKIEARVGEMEVQLREWGVKLEELLAAAELAGAEAKAEYCKRLDGLRAKHQAVRAKLEELRAAGSGKWETLEAGVEGAWRELDDAFRRLSN